MSKITLGIETSHELGGVALAMGGQCIGEVLSSAKFKHSEELIVLIDSVLKESGHALGDLGAVAVSVGPGSFTGLRVGLATAKGLCLSRGLPLVAIPTLDALASTVREVSMPIHAVIDAKRGEVYWASYQWRDGALEKTGGYEALTPKSFTDRLTVEAVVVGSGLDRYRDHILENSGVPVVLLEPNPSFPNPSEISVLGSERLRADQFSDIGSIEPIYIRPSDAETGRKKTPD